MKVSCAMLVIAYLSSGTLVCSQNEGWEINEEQGDICLASSNRGNSLLAR